MIPGSKCLPAENASSGLSSAGGLVALRIGKSALFQKIRMFERSEFGFFGTPLADLPILSATCLRSRKPEEAFSAGRHLEPGGRTVRVLLLGNGGS